MSCASATAPLLARATPRSCDEFSKVLIRRGRLSAHCPPPKNEIAPLASFTRICWVESDCRAAGSAPSTWTPAAPLIRDEGAERSKVAGAGADEQAPARAARTSTGAQRRSIQALLLGGRDTGDPHIE